MPANFPASGGRTASNQSKTVPAKIVGLGEALFDCFENHQTLGGAPLNATLVAHQLAQALQCGPDPDRLSGQMVSRVGRDDLGTVVLKTLHNRGLETGTIQEDATQPTGRVLVEMVAGEPSYEILAPAAWDFIQWDQAIEDLVPQTKAVLFGSLGQRNPVSRATIQRFLQSTPHAIRLFDVNLRQHFFDAQTLQQSCALANVLKLNEEELGTIAALLEIEAKDVAFRLRDRFEFAAIILTHGIKGTELITESGSFTGFVPKFSAEEGADPVGAGDACAATCLLGILSGWDPQKIVDSANTVGAYVASRRGATPEIPAGLI